MYDAWLSWKQPASVSVKSSVITVMSFWQAFFGSTVLFILLLRKQNKYLTLEKKGLLQTPCPHLPQCLHAQNERGESFASVLLMTAFLPK